MCDEQMFEFGAYVITTCFLIPHLVLAQSELPQARIVNLIADPGQVMVLHVRPGYVDSVRVLDEVSSVVLGDPGSFKAEHSEAQPQLVSSRRRPQSQPKPML